MFYSQNPTVNWTSLHGFAVLPASAQIQIRFLYLPRHLWGPAQHGSPRRRWWPQWSLSPHKTISQPLGCWLCWLTSFEDPLLQSFRRQWPRRTGEERGCCLQSGACIPKGESVVHWGEGNKYWKFCFHLFSHRILQIYIFVIFRNVCKISGYRKFVKWTNIFGYP